ncbi:hypothetical protein [Chitinophaga alhagiae]|uniref:hypothetical protein n=1 Tax=Chitinophaga alhagiae TaxID=2203219 RepID=UPI0013007E07|nr:hypothetical protein [Chitinophaga alhagiae]
MLSITEQTCRMGTYCSGNTAWPNGPVRPWHNMQQQQQQNDRYMEWVSIKPVYNNGIIQEDPAQPVFSLLTKAGFQLEQVRRNVAPAAIEYFYFHPGLHIQVHEVNEMPLHPPRFFIFYPGGSTAYAEGLDQLRLCFAAG